MTDIRALFKQVVPLPLLMWLRRRRVAAMRARNQQRTTRDVFTAIYDTNEWGGRPGEYCSGSGSKEKYSLAYGGMVREFVQAHGVQRIVDLGCGDFVIGRALLSPGVSYVGVDIVEGLIETNTRLHGTDTISFRCLDIVNDPLPEGDLCLVRQVLQHCSNDQIQRVLHKLSQFRHVMITEHYPAPGLRVVPNRDKPAGGDTRLVDNSAVYLDRPPFNARIDRVMLEVVIDEHVIAPGEVLRTVLLDPNHVR